MDEANVICYVNKLPIRLLARRKFSNLHPDGTCPTVGLSCLFPTKYQKRSLLSLSDCFLPIHSSASNCFLLRSPVAEVPQRPLPDLSPPSLDTVTIPDSHSPSTCLLQQHVSLSCLHWSLTVSCHFAKSPLLCRTFILGPLVLYSNQIVSLAPTVSNILTIPKLLFPPLFLSQALDLYFRLQLHLPVSGLRCRARLKLTAFPSSPLPPTQTALPFVLAIFSCHLCSLKARNLF